MVFGWRRLESEGGHEAGRALLRHLFCANFGTELPPIAVTERGKPYFENSGLHFSISHTDKHVFCCISEKNIGIDGEECHRRVHDAVAKKILSPTEFARWEQAEDRDACLLRLWVLKESYAKLTGRGLGDYLRQTDFDPNDPRIQIIDGCYVAIMEDTENAF